MLYYIKMLYANHFENTFDDRRYLETQEQIQNCVVLNVTYHRAQWNHPFHPPILLMEDSTLIQFLKHKGT